MRLSHAAYVESVRADGESDPLPMYLWLWGRGPSDSLAVDGEPASADHLRARLVAATR